MRNLKTAAAALVAAIGFCGASASANETLTVGFPSSPLGVQFAYFGFGEELGFFEEENIDLEYSLVTGSSVLLPQVATGRVDVGLTNPDFVVIAAAKGEPLPVTFVMNWFRIHGFEFAVLEDSPVQKLEDLKDKKLGVGALTWGNIPMSRAMLAEEGITWGEDIEIFPVGIGPAAWRRLETGEIDAINLFVSQHGSMELAGFDIRRLPLPDDFRSIFSNGWVASNDFMAEKPDTIAGFGRALVKSWIACRTNPEACVKAHWKRYPAEAPTAHKEAEQLAIDSQRAVFDGKLIDDFTGSEFETYGTYDAATWDRLVNLMYAQGQIDNNDVDVAELFDNQFVDRFNDFDMDAVKSAAEAAKP